MMKRLLLIVTLTSVMCATWAQTSEGNAVNDGGDKKSSSTNTTYVSETAFIDKYHNEVELEKMGKLELTNLYLERVSVLTEIIPYLALNKAPAGAGLAELGIPETKTNTSHLDREVSNKVAYLKAVKETMNDIIPYADKKNIIWCILFLEDTLHRVNKAAEADK